MADDPSRGQPGFEPLPGWPRPPGQPAPPPAGGAPPPSAPPPGWSGARPPWAEPLPGPTPPEPHSGPPPPPGPRRGRGFPGGRRGLAIAGAVVALLAVAAVVAVVVSPGGDGSGGGAQRAGGTRDGGRGSAPAATAGKEVPLLEGRLIFVTPFGWEVRDNTPITGTIQAQLREPTGRELLGTVVATALPGEGSFDHALAVDGGTRFRVDSASGPLEAVVTAERGQVLAGAARPSGRFLISLSVYAMDGRGLDAAQLQKLFTEQVVPQLKFP